MKKYVFSKQEKEAIQEAVRDLEKVSCGEIVPFYAQKSDRYEEVRWQLATLLGLSALITVLFLSYTWSLPPLSLGSLTVGILSLMGVGYLLPLFFPVLKRVLVSEEKMEEMVSLRAREAFLNEKVYNTAERVGILIYVSRLEHLVVVLGDEQINAKIRSEDWEKVVSLTIEGVRKNRIGSGFVNAIHHCKELLLTHGFVRKDTDYNELSDELRTNE